MQKLKSMQLKYNIFPFILVNEKGDKVFKTFKCAAAEQIAFQLV